MAKLVTGRLQKGAVTPVGNCLGHSAQIGIWLLVVSPWGQLVVQYPLTIAGGSGGQKVAQESAVCPGSKGISWNANSGILLLCQVPASLSAQCPWPSTRTRSKSSNTTGVVRAGAWTKPFSEVHWDRRRAAGTSCNVRNSGWVKQEKNRHKLIQLWNQILEKGWHLWCWCSGLAGWGAPCFEQEIGLETSRGSFPPAWLAVLAGNQLLHRH